MRASTNPPVGGAEEQGGTAEPEKGLKIKVKFNSLIVYNDHDGFFPSNPALGGPGEWQLMVAMTGHPSTYLYNGELSGKLPSGQIYNFHNKEFTVNMEHESPFRITVYGLESDGHQDDVTVLGKVDVSIPPPNYNTILTEDQIMLTGPNFEKLSSTWDYALRFTVSAVYK
jgi:hypothetical protein